MARRRRPGVTEATVREIALGLPRAEESPTWGGDPGFKVGKKLFVHLYRDGRLSLRIDRDTRQLLVGSDPETFENQAPSWPFVTVRLDRIDRDRLEELITDAWRVIAPKRVVAEYDAERD